MNDKLAHEVANRLLELGQSSETFLIPSVHILEGYLAVHTRGADGVIRFFGSIAGRSITPYLPG